MKKVRFPSKAGKPGFTKRGYLKKRRFYGRKWRLPTSYKKQSTYSFCRETLPLTLPFSIIPAGSSFPAIGYLEFANLQFNQLVQSTTEFGNLFARYKIDKIETILTPLWSQVVDNPATYSTTPALRVTRINTKWLNGPLNLGTNSDDVLGELAQIQAKSVSPYASRKSLKLVTKNPGVVNQGVVDSTGTEIETRIPSPWLNIGNQADVPLKHNSVIFAERTDGQALTTDWKYRVVHKIYFRCAQVG